MHTTEYYMNPPPEHLLRSGGFFCHYIRIPLVLFLHPLYFPSSVCGVNVTPYGRVEEDEQWEQLETSGEHVEHQHVFGEDAEVNEVLCRTCEFESGTDVVDCSGDRGKVGN